MFTELAGWTYLVPRWVFNAITTAFVVIGIASFFFPLLPPLDPNDPHSIEKVFVCGAISALAFISAALIGSFHLGYARPPKAQRVERKKQKQSRADELRAKRRTYRQIMEGTYRVDQERIGKMEQELGINQ